jgi:hypothetical protein
MNWLMRLLGFDDRVEHTTTVNDDGTVTHRATYTMHPPLEDEVEAYAYFGLPFPATLTSTSRAHAAAMRHPWIDRTWHRRYANRNGLFWIPCPQCGREFGGHEVCGRIQDPDYPDDPSRGVGVCALCAVENFQDS